MYQLQDNVKIMKTQVFFIFLETFEICLDANFSLLYALKFLKRADIFPFHLWVVNSAGKLYLKSCLNKANPTGSAKLPTNVSIRLV